MQKKPSLIKILLGFGCLLCTALACSLGSAGSPNSLNITIVKTETPLNDLRDSQHVLTLVDYYSGSEGIYWLDIDRHTLYLAQLPRAKGTTTQGEYTWLPERHMSAWNGSTLVYGSRISGFFSLSPDGTARQITGQGYVGKLAHNGEQILRFSECGSNEEGRTYAITSLDQLVSSTAPCFLPGYFRSEETAWKYVEPVWNPYLPQVDFIVSERYGQGDSMRVISNTLVRPTQDDRLLELLELGADFDILGNNIIPSPDGRAFYVRGPSETFIIDAGGDRIVDLNQIISQPSGTGLNSQFAWSPDSQQAVLFVEACAEGVNCSPRILLWTKGIQQVQEITTLPAGFRFDEILWSPDSTHIALVNKSHDGPDHPPRIYTIDVLDKSVRDYVFPAQSILENVQWVR